MPSRRSLLATASGAASAAALARPAIAQAAWPNRPVRVMGRRRLPLAVRAPAGAA
jgi:hypothetical protein